MRGGSKSQTRKQIANSVFANVVSFLKEIDKEKE